MDPLSITASIAALIGLIDTTIRGVRLLTRLKDIPLLLQQLNNELADLGLIVGEIQDTYHLLLESGLETMSHQQVVFVAIDRAKEIVHDLEIIIAYDLQRVSRDNTPRMSRRSWIQNKNRIKELRDRLQVAKDDISRAMTVDKMYAIHLKISNMCLFLGGS